jgi:hypothetical protein
MHRTIPIGLLEIGPERPIKEIIEPPARPPPQRFAAPQRTESAGHNPPLGPPPGGCGGARGNPSATNTPGCWVETGETPGSAPGGCQSSDALFLGQVVIGEILCDNGFDLVAVEIGHGKMRISTDAAIWKMNDLGANILDVF